MSRPRVLFACDAGPEVGGGHVMRSLTLAGALAKVGAHAAFLCPPAVAGVLDRFDRTRVERVVTGELPTANDYSNAVVADGDADLVVVDHFGWAAADDDRLSTRALATIDDLADRPRRVDWLLDPTPSRRAQDYAALLPSGAEQLLGPSYALVRPNFVQARESALARRRRSPKVQRGLISLGLTDLGGITEQVLAVLSRHDSVALDIVLGPAAPSLPAIRRRVETGEPLALHVASKRMAELMSEADVAIGAGGSSTWERACLGLPTITLVLADNQQPATEALERAGVTWSVDVRRPGWELRLRELWARLLEEADTRAAFAERAGALVDGRGAERAAASLMRLAGYAPATGGRS